MIDDDRAQSFTYIMAGATLILFALIYAIFQDPVADLLAQAAEDCVSAACDTGHGHIEAAWTWLPLVAVGMVVIMIIAAAVQKSRGP